MPRRALPSRPGRARRRVLRPSCVEGRAALQVRSIFGDADCSKGREIKSLIRLRNAHPEPQASRVRPVPS